MERGNYSMKKYINKNHTADCIKFMQKLPTEEVDLILTDPPYNASRGGISLPNNKTGGAYHKVNEDWDKFKDNKSYFEFTKNWIIAADRTLKPGGAIMVCGTLHNIGEMISVLKSLDYKFINLITWKKTNPMPNITKRMLTHSTEFVAWFSKGKGWTFNYDEMKKYNNGKQLRDVWEFSLCQGKERIKNKEGKTAHPTQKPLELFKRLIEMSTKPGEIVLDPFMGSGTTAEASKLLKRNWVGVDNNPNYVKISNIRVLK
jgi:site-specific DNA-methyltransferase (adenine-specific)